MIKLENISKFYKTEKGVAVGVQKVNLEFVPGEFIALTGESGSGKSTLLNVISGLDGYEEGEMYVNGEETSHYTVADWEKFRASNIGFVFQNYNIIDSYTVYQNVVLALEVQGYEKAKIKERAMELIDLVGLTSHKNHKASKLSGGQKQRCVIARALAKDTPIIMADEPTGNLDSKSGEQIMQLLSTISKDKLVVVVTHDYEQVEPYATRRIKMYDGQVVEDKKIKTIKTNQNKLEAVQPEELSYAKSLKFAIRNLFSTPKKLFFSVLVQTIVLFLIITMYASQLQSIKSIQGYSGYGTNQQQITVRKTDGKDFTQSELNKIAAISNVKDIIKTPGALMQRSGFSFGGNTYQVRLKFDRYNSNGYLFGHTAQSSNYSDEYHRSVNVYSASAYTGFQIKEGGRLPQNKNEIIVVTGTPEKSENFEYGKEYEISFDTYNVVDVFNYYTPIDQPDIKINVGRQLNTISVTKKFTVVGEVKQSHTGNLDDGFAFHSSFFDNEWLNVFDANKTGFSEISVDLLGEDNILINTKLSTQLINVIPSNKLSGNEFTFSLEHFTRYRSYNHGGTVKRYMREHADVNSIELSFYNEFNLNKLAFENATYVEAEDVFDDYAYTTFMDADTNRHLFYEFNTESDSENYPIKANVGVGYSMWIVVSEEMYQQVMDMQKTLNEVVVIVEDISVGKGVFKSIKNLSDEFLIIYPSNIIDMSSSMMKFINEIMTVVTLSLILAFGFAIISWTQRSVLNTRKKDFAIFRSIGTTEKTLRFVVTIEQVLLTLLCLVITAGVVVALTLNVYEFYTMFRHVSLANYAVAFALLMAFSVRMSRKFNKKLFTQTVISTLGS